MNAPKTQAELLQEKLKTLSNNRFIKSFLLSQENKTKSINPVSVEEIPTVETEEPTMVKKIVETIELPQSKIIQAIYEEEDKVAEEYLEISLPEMSNNTNEKVKIADEEQVVKAECADEVEIELDWVKSFANGLLEVGKDNKKGLLSADGRELIPINYDNLKFFTDNIIIVSNIDQWGENKSAFVILYETNENIELKYEKILALQENLAAVCCDGKWGFVDNNGVEIISPQYDYVSNFRYSHSLVFKDDKMGFINTKGEEIIPLQEEYLRIIWLGKSLIWVNQNNKWGVNDLQGKEILAAVYDEFRDFSNELVLVSQNNKYGLLNRTAQEILPTVYDDIKPATAGLAWVKIADKWKFIDRKGKESQWFVNKILN